MKWLLKSIILISLLHIKSFGDVGCAALTYEEYLRDVGKKSDLICVATLVDEYGQGKAKIQMKWKLSDSITITRKEWKQIKVERCLKGQEKGDTVYAFSKMLGYGRTDYVFPEKEYLLPDLIVGKKYLFFLKFEKEASKKNKNNVYGYTLVVSEEGIQATEEILKKINDKQK